MKIHIKNNLYFSDTEIHSSPLNVESVINILDKAITTEEMPIRQKLMFSQRKIEFLEDFGNRVDQLTKTKDDHEKLAEVMKKEAKVDERSNRNRYKKEYCLKKIGLIHIKILAVIYEIFAIIGRVVKCQISMKNHQI